MVEVHGGSWPKSSPERVTACTVSIPDQDIVLVDSGREALTFSDSGLIKLSRRVVSVELSGQLVVNVEAKYSGKVAKGYSIFTPKMSTISYQTCCLGGKKKRSDLFVMGITVAWSVFNPLTSSW
ncbi:hypothetical protein PR202_ga09279 [Eleusine coracana subsp. coracana]|uniref:DUF6598 domain-containing protein n=1 Tax=Eleusine coracana subsp. coracana TaxID=191504 RepID=A0AAV5C3J5_ELECO|nr:hypothetical protein PR202_ga09279 [Eleusine coracana subsp. coracana]